MVRKTIRLLHDVETGFGEEEWYAGNEIGRSREGAEGEWKRIAVWQWQRYLSGTEGERRSTGVD
jgi:hypothetical protein